MEEHCDQIRSVSEGDTVTISTTNGNIFDATCEMKDTQYADPRSGEIRETRIWLFNAVEFMPIVSILDGLKSSPDDPDFPVHKQVYCRDTEQSLGFIDRIDIHE